jgi:hypothetical protein
MSALRRRKDLTNSTVVIDAVKRMEGEQMLPGTPAEAGDPGGSDIGHSGMMSRYCRPTAVAFAITQSGI